MSRRRFYVPRDCIREDAAVLPHDQAHHLRNVLRLQPGDRVELFDGQGAGYTGVVDLSDRNIRVVSLSRIEVSAVPEPRFILAQALLKSDKFEWVLQKATELGVHEIVPLETRYSDRRLSSQRAASRMERWNRIVREASKQCRRLTVPHIHSPLQFVQFLEIPPPENRIRMLFYEEAKESWKPSKSDGPDAMLCVGPEGGWHPDEIQAATTAGFRVVGLGPRILRAETAALVVLTLASFRNGV